MAEKTAVPKTLYVDPSVYIPEGLQYVKPLIVKTVSEGKDPGEEDTDLDDGTIDLATEESLEELLSVPDDLIVIDSTIRVARNGQGVVDLTVEVPDVSGAVNYEFRITKI